VRYARRLRMIRRVLPEEVRSVLLIGCGYGRWISDLTAMGFRVTAIDVAPSIIRRVAARNERLRGLVLCADAHELLFSGASFDAVVSISTLHHLMPLIAPPELRRVLRSDGVLLGSEPDRLNPQVWWMLSSRA